MKTRLYITLLFLVVHFFSVAQCQPRRKRGYRWHIRQSEQLSNAANIRFDGIYLETRVFNGVSKYQYLIFFPNGRFFESCQSDAKPDSTQVCELNKYGMWGAFTTEDSTVVCEKFHPYNGYYVHFGVVRGDKFVFHSYGKKKWFREHRIPFEKSYEYVFIPMKINCKSDW